MRPTLGSKQSLPPPARPCVTAPYPTFRALVTTWVIAK